MLTVIGIAPPRSGKSQSNTRWTVRCECGTVKEMDAKQLTRKDRKNTKSCGCINHRTGADSVHWKSPNEIPMTYWTACKSNARHKDREFSISIEYAFEVWVSQFGLCALSGEYIELGKTASLDRIDSSIGYKEGNIQWLHKTINSLKSDLTEDEFISWCRKVTEHND